MPNDRLLNKVAFGEVRGQRPPSCPMSYLNDVVLHDCHMTVKTVMSVGHIGMHRTACSGETRLALLIPSSDHELGCVDTITILTL